jgi:hypothetical protein
VAAVRGAGGAAPPRPAGAPRRAALALAVAALVAVQTNVVALPGWVPAIPVAPFGTPLADGPARGALARGAAWFDGLRDRMEDHADPDGTWRVAPRSAIRLIFAGTSARTGSRCCSCRCGPAWSRRRSWSGTRARAAPRRRGGSGRRTCPATSRW